MLPRFGHRAQPANGAVQAHQLLPRQRLRSLEQLADPFIGGRRLPFFLIRHRQDAQGEDLVDLAPVEQIAGAFGAMRG